MQKETAKQIGHRVQKQCKGLKNSIASQELVALLCILIVGLLLRGVYLAEIVKKPSFASPEIDARFHDYWARGLVWGDWSPPTNLPDPEISTSPYIRPPGYPYFLALIYVLTGPNYMAPRIVQMGLGLLNCVLAFILGRTLFGRWSGVIFAALMSIYWIFIYFEGELLASVLLVFLSLSLMLVLSFWRSKFTYLRTIGAGLIFGLAAVVRPNILLFGPAILMWGWWLKRRRANKQFLRVAVVGFVLGAAAVIAPVTARNYLVADDFVLITSNVGVNFYIGNNEKTDCVWPSIPIIEPLTGKRGWTCFDYPTIVRGVECLEGKRMKHSEVSAYFTGKAIEFIRENPAKALSLLVKKILLFWGPAEVSNNWELECEREHSVILRYLPRFPAVLSLCIVGIGLLCLDFRSRHKQGSKCNSQAEQLEVCVLVVLFIVTYFVSYLPFFAAARYRVAIIPFLLLFSSYALYRIYQFIRERNLTASICATTIVIGLYAIAARPFIPYEPDVALWHQDQGNAYLRTGQINRAIEEYLKSVRLKPANYRTRARLGSAFFLQRNYDEAIIHWSEAVRLRPNDHKTHTLLGEAFLKQGNIDKAILHWSEAARLRPNEPVLCYNLALAFHTKGMIKEAIKHYREALRLKPDYVKAKENLKMVLAQKKIQDDSKEIEKRPDLNNNSPKDE